jgi:hypothetical protein
MLSHQTQRAATVLKARAAKGPIQGRDAADNSVASRGEVRALQREGRAPQSGACAGPRTTGRGPKAPVVRLYPPPPDPAQTRGGQRIPPQSRQVREAGSRCTRPVPRTQSCLGGCPNRASGAAGPVSIPTSDPKKGAACPPRRGALRRGQVVIIPSGGRGGGNRGPDNS